MSSKPIVKISLISLVLCVVLSACGMMPSFNKTGFSESISETFPVSPTNTPQPLATATQAPSPTTTQTVAPTASPTITSTPDMRLDPEDWQSWPIVPFVSAKAKAIYEAGLAAGNYPDRFSKVGDCQNITTYFLAIFDNPKQYDLGEDYAYLQETIGVFEGSFSRESIAIGGGMNVAAVLTYRWANQDICESLESPLACELRLHKPSIVLISMEETWGRDNQVENYEKYMRQVLDTVIAAGAVPILGTKASNLEGDHRINRVIAQLAYEYDIPLWNFWRAVQPLPNQGLLEDGFHLTHGKNFYDDPKNLEQAWPIRNLTALQTIDAVWRELNNLPLAEN